MLLEVYILKIIQQTARYSIIVQNVKLEFFDSGHKVMHREEKAKLNIYLSDNMKIFTCMTPFDDQPIVVFNRVQDPCVPIQNNYSVDQQKPANFFNTRTALHNNHDTTRCIAQQQNVASQQLRYLQKNYTASELSSL